jgi:hypothetical protein
MTLEANLDAIRASNKALAEHDVEGLLKLLPASFKINIVFQPKGLMPQGYQIDDTTFLDSVRHFYDVLPDCHIEEIDARYTQKSIYLNLMISGTHRSTLILPTGASIPPSCQPVQIPIELYSMFDSEGVLIGSTCYISLSDVLGKAGISEAFLQV